MSSNTYGYIADTGPTQAYGNLPRKYNPISATGKIEYLVIAGGGSGGSDGGGGGAGGYRTSYGSGNISGANSAVEGDLAFIKGDTFTVTVGAGGAAVTNAVGNNGSNSVFSTITSTGGGAGGMDHN